MSNDPIEQRLREIIIGDIEPQNIVVVDYDPAWPERFRREEARIRSSLGEAALSVEHIGSTSVPGLAAKPIVDVLLVVEDSGDEPSYLPALEEAGYVLRVREPDFDEHRMFRSPALFILAWFVLGFLSPGYTIFGTVIAPYSPISQPISGLGLGPTAPFMNAAFVLSGILLMAGVIGVFHTMKSSSQPAARWACVALLELTPLGLMIAGILTLEEPFLHLIGWWSSSS